MESITLNDLLDIIKLYNPDEVENVKTINVIKASSRSERKRIIDYFVGVLGFALLIYAYITAINMPSAIANMSDVKGIVVRFATDVVFVIVATFLVFSAGSAVILSGLRRIKSIYYKKNNFINISGLAFRMRRNGLGLASICILFTMVIVSCSGLISFYSIVDPYLITGIKANAIVNKEFRIDHNDSDNPEDYRVVVIKNANFFGTTKKTAKAKTKVEKKTDELDCVKKYLDNPVLTTILIFECPLDKIDSKKTLVKQIEDNGKVIECSFLSEGQIVKYVSDCFKKEGVIIDDDALRELTSRISKNPINYKNEVEKVVIYSNRENRVTKRVIEDLIINDIQKNQFDLVNGIIDKNKKMALDAYYDYIKHKMEPLIILKMIINKFEEILRHNNVSDKENAFNRLVALFICKLVDESQCSDSDEVQFQYKRGIDTYETLQDRLQKLHKIGMEKFMREKMFYIESDYAERLFETYTGRQRKQAINELNKTIRILKFFSNNDLFL